MSANSTSGGSWVEIADPTVINDAGQLTIWCWGVTQDQGSGLARATSADGLEWMFDEELALTGRPGTWEHNVNVPSILADASGYRMWYAGYPGCGVGHAVSVDGKLWARDEANPIFTASQPWEGPCVDTPSVYSDGAVYRMWYAAGSELNSGRIGHATSTDGLSWRKHPGNPILREGSPDVSRGAGLPCVLFDQRTSSFEMWYTTFDAPTLAGTSIAYAVSMDGLAWAKHSGNPVLVPGGGDSEVFRSSVLFDGSEYRMWYSARIGDTYGISHATAPWTIPRASFSATPVSAVNSEPIDFDAAASVSPNGEITSYRWDFGDGVTAEGKAASHAYAQPGHYAVHLTVADAAGKEGSVARALDVNLRPGDVAPWTSADVGGHDVPSAARLEGAGTESEALRLYTHGGDIGVRADDAQLVSRDAGGDFVLTARIDLFEAAAPGAKVGLMVREGLGAGARHAAIVLQGASTRRARLLRRLAADGSTRATDGPALPLPGAPWLRLQRRGSVITAFTSQDGAGWEQMGEPVTFDPPLTGVVQAGVAAAGGRPGLEGGYQDVRASIFRPQIVVPGVGPFLRGDCNGDGDVAGEVTDAVFLLAHSFTGGAAPPCLAACDSNADGATDISDAIHLLGFNFLGGPPPAMPFPACGRSEVEGDTALGCGTPLAPCP